MQVFISADIEGISGITDWSQATKGQPEHATFARRMSDEVQAAINGAKAAGANRIVVRDAHGSGDNLDDARLDKDVEIIRRYNGHPDHMMFGLTKDFDAALLVGYHAAAAAGGNPLAHTLSSRSIHRITINGTAASEFLLSAYMASEKGVPVVFVSGDARLGEEVVATQGDIVFAPTFRAEGSTVSHVHPEEACRRIEAGVKETLSRSHEPIRLPRRFEVEIEYRDHKMAYRMQFYPGAKRKDPMTIAFSSKDFEQVKTFLVFAA